MKTILNIAKCLFYGTWLIGLALWYVLDVWMFGRQDCDGVKLSKPLPPWTSV